MRKLKDYPEEVWKFFFETMVVRVKSYGFIILIKNLNFLVFLFSLSETETGKLSEVNSNSNSSLVDSQAFVKVVQTMKTELKKMFSFHEVSTFVPTQLTWSLNRVLSTLTTSTPLFTLHHHQQSCGPLRVNPFASWKISRLPPQQSSLLLLS